MPWKEETVEDQRRAFVIRANEAGCNFSALCREFQITRRTGYKWLERYRAGEALEDQSRVPRHQAPREGYVDDIQEMRLCLFSFFMIFGKETCWNN